MTLSNRGLGFRHPSQQASASASEVPTASLRHASRPKDFRAWAPVTCHITSDQLYLPSTGHRGRAQADAPEARRQECRIQVVQLRAPSLRLGFAPRTQSRVRIGGQGRQSAGAHHASTERGWHTQKHDTRAGDSLLWINRTIIIARFLYRPLQLLS